MPSCPISFTRDFDLTAIQPNEPATACILRKSFLFKVLPPSVALHETIKSLLSLVVRAPQYFSKLSKSCSQQERVDKSLRSSSRLTDTAKNSLIETMRIGFVIFASLD